ncbi:MAG TPA: VanW family protein [Armatimonadota bacterium]
MPRSARYLVVAVVLLGLPLGVWLTSRPHIPGLTAVQAPKPPSPPPPPPLPERITFVDGKRTLTMKVERLGMDRATHAVDHTRLQRRVKRIARSLDYPGVNSRLAFVPSASGPDPLPSAVTPSKLARRLDQPTLVAALEEWAARKRPEARVELPMRIVPPDVPAEDLAKVKVPLASFTTRFNPGNRDRTHNLRLVAQRLNGGVVMPGQVFSFNDRVGPRIEGFRKAHIFVKGKIKEDLGGGTCQVSTTLYNATLLAGLPIAERNYHSLTVPYIPPGRDATVYWGSKDYKFRNPTKAPIYVRAVPKGGRLRVTLYGAEAPRDRVEVVSDITRGQHKVSATVYRVFRRGDQVVLRERLHRNTYGLLEDAEREFRELRRAARAGVRSPSEAPRARSPRSVSPGASAQKGSPEASPAPAQPTSEPGREPAADRPGSQGSAPPHGEAA